MLVLDRKSGEDQTWLLKYSREERGRRSAALSRTHSSCFDDARVLSVSLWRSGAEDLRQERIGVLDVRARASYLATSPWGMIDAAVIEERSCVRPWAGVEVGKAGRKMTEETNSKEAPVCFRIARASPSGSSWFRNYRAVEDRVLI